MSRSSIPSLDGIRALSITVVVAAHLVVGVNRWIPGSFGVTVFFFLSGYLITTLLRQEFDRRGRIDLRAFYLRRILRLFPPFYLVLGLACLLTMLGLLEDQTLRLINVVPQLLYATNYEIVHAGWWTGRAPGTAVYWSLAVEEHFYLVFPLLYLGLRRYLPSPRRQLLVLLTLCAAVLAWRCLLVFDLHAAKERTYVATDTRIDSILFGCALAVYGNPVLDQVRTPARRWNSVWLPLGGLGLLLSFVVRSPQFQETFRYTLQGIALVPFFVAAIRQHDRGAFRLLNLRPVRYVGVISYSIYLLHPSVIYGLHDHRLRPIPVAVQSALGLLCTLLLAAAIHRCVERPFAQLRRRLSRAEVPAHPVLRRAHTLDAADPEVPAAT